MDSIDNFFRESHYNIIRILLSIAGLWPFQSKGKRRAIYFVFLLVLGSGMTFEVLGMVEVWSDTFEMVDCLPLIILGALSTLKVVCLVYTLPKIKILLTKMKEYWYSPKSDEETKILYSHALYGRKLGYGYTVIILGHSFVYLLTTLLSKFIHVQLSEETNESNKIKGAQTGIPYRVNYMVDIDTYYVPIYIHTAVCDASYCALLVVVDVLYLTMVQHCCGLFTALRYRLENTFIFQDDMSNLTGTFIKNRSYLDVAYSIQRHTEVMQFSSILESIYRLPLLIHMGCNISIISIVGFQAITNTENANRFLIHGIYFSGAVISMFFENWQGQKMIDYSEKVYNSAYNAEWYRMPDATKKLFIMIIMRSIKPSQITAGKFITMSYVNFNTVMRISSSYFMLLRSMQPS